MVNEDRARTNNKKIVRANKNESSLGKDSPDDLLEYILRMENKVEEGEEKGRQ